MGDSIIREALARDGTPVTHRIAAAGGAFPLGIIPIGSSFMMFELALASARTMSLAGQPTLNRLVPIAVQSQPSRTRLLFAAPDSIEVDYFGQGRFGFNFDADCRLMRSDWRNTTYRVLVVRVSAFTLNCAESAYRQRLRDRP